MRTRTRFWGGLLLPVCLSAAALAAETDPPFRQPVAVKFTAGPELAGARYRRLCITRDGIVYVLTDRGVARLFDTRVALDRSFRPLAAKVARDITLGGGELFYLYDDQFLSNAFSGERAGALPRGIYQRFAVADDGTVLLASRTNLALFADGKLTAVPSSGRCAGARLCVRGNAFFALTADAIYRVGANGVALFQQGSDLTALALAGPDLLVGTRRGYYAVNPDTGNTTRPLQERLPAVEMTCFAPTTNGLWAGTTHGVWFQAGPKSFRYFAGQRWLSDDEVVDLQLAPDGEVFILTKGGLGKIGFLELTLARKAAYFEAKIRQRHMRYGFCAELRLANPGDITTAEMIDTDNDGSWSSLYLASQAFRYAATGEPEARAHAWETFETLKRLQTINGLDGFPSRTFERTGFKVSDPDRWHTAPDTNWEWKATTSSDEIAMQTFALAVLYETVARTPAERQRIAAVYDPIIAHIVRHNLYLVDVDGQPTLWGRWNPEYVNWYPPTIGDRRLNSSEIIAFLQFGYRVTGNELYQQKASELLYQHGYLQNITNSLRNLRVTPGYVFRDNDMGDGWNHSDDELAFYNYWTLYRFAFTDQLRRLYAGAIKDHWAIEKAERNPSWNFIYAMTGARGADLDGALWTLRCFPLDLITWTVRNSDRGDLTRLPPNFRDQTTVELLPPDERPTSRWNNNPFTLDGGDGGHGELAGDEFLVPYWMGRYLGLIR